MTEVTYRELSAAKAVEDAARGADLIVARMAHSLLEANSSGLDEGSLTSEERGAAASAFKENGQLKQHLRAAIFNALAQKFLIVPAERPS